LGHELSATQQRLTSLSPAGHIERERQRIDDLTRRQERALRHNLALNKTRFAGLARRLEGLNPYATLERGYAIVRDQDGQVVLKTKQAVPGKQLQIRVSDGAFSARVE
jgi:exodeoxyribonuclease VII large subunit